MGCGHFIQRCSSCMTVLAQCRCFSPAKSTSWVVCSKCKEGADMLESVATKREMKPKPKTIRVRIAVAAGTLGPWDVESYTVDQGGDERARIGAIGKLKHARYVRHEEMNAPFVTHFIEAPIPLPESVTVEGEVGK